MFFFTYIWIKRPLYVCTSFSNYSRPQLIEDNQQTVLDPFTTIIPLNLRSSGTRSTRLQRSTTNISNLFSTVAQTNTDPLPQSSDTIASNSTQNDSHMQTIPNFTSQIRERGRTAALRRFSGMYNSSFLNLLYQ